jgi:putative ABC transport system permease protein
MSSAHAERQPYDMPTVDRHLERPFPSWYDAYAQGTTGRPGENQTMGAYLAFKEIWRNRGRYLLVSLVVALLTALVLFIAGLAEGLGLGNIEYLKNLDADLIAYQADAQLLIAASRIPRGSLQDIERVEGVKAAGPVEFSRVSIILPGTTPQGAQRKPLDVSLIQVEPGRPGEPPARLGQQLLNRRGKDALIDSMVARRAGLTVGDDFAIRVLQGTREEFYSLRVVGITASQQYSIQPSIIVPLLTGDQLRPKPVVEDRPSADLSSNIVAIQLDLPADPREAGAFRQIVAERLEAQVKKIEVVDIPTAYQNTPGYGAQQGTLNTQRYFALVIGVMVLGGFFQIQALQKVPQIGVLKAIGASNFTVALASLIQITLVTLTGVLIGGLVTLGLAVALPSGIPIIFTPQSVATALISLTLIGPIGGLVSIRYSLRVEPLAALGLTS